MQRIVILNLIVIVIYIKAATSIDTYYKTRSLLNKTAKEVSEKTLFKWNIEDKEKNGLDQLNQNTKNELLERKQTRLIKKKLELKKKLINKQFKTTSERNLSVKKLKSINAELKKLKINIKKQRERRKSKKVHKNKNKSLALNTKKKILLKKKTKKKNKQIKKIQTNIETTSIIPTKINPEKMSNDAEKIVPTQLVVPKHQAYLREEYSNSPKLQSSKLSKLNKNYKIDFKNCRKSKGKCSCYKGFRLVSNRCVDINECLTKNGGCEGKCINHLGYFTCSCPNGKQLSTNKLNCVDINECQLNNGRGLCSGKCWNTQGSYYCTCDNLNGTKLAYNKHNCEDIDECLEGTSGCSHLCYNYPGKYYCSCPDGMKLQLDDKTCEDIDECQNIEIQKKCNFNCKNKIGSYECVNENDNLGDGNIVQSDIICPKIDVPVNGYFNCTRPIHIKSFTGRELMLNTAGTMCHFMCAEDYKPKRGALICQNDGNWKSTTKYRFTCNSRQI